MIRVLREEDLKDAHKLRCERIEPIPFEEFKEQFSENPDLFVGAFEDGLIGLCYGIEFRGNPKEFGMQSDKVVLLRGVAVTEKHARKGIGSQLLRFFEGQVKKKGKYTINLGSAGGYVEKFYLKNGYTPVCFRVTVKEMPVSIDYEIMGQRKEDDSMIFYIKSQGYEPEKKEVLREQLQAEDVIYIFEKEV